MAKRIDEVVVDALELPLSDRATLAELLLRSLEEGAPEPGLSPAWQDEIQRRLREVESGEAVLLPAEEVFARLDERLRDL